MLSEALGESIGIFHSVHGCNEEMLNHAKIELKYKSIYYHMEFFFSQITFNTLLKKQASLEVLLST